MVRFRGTHPPPFFVTIRMIPPPLLLKNIWRYVAPLFHLRELFFSRFVEGRARFFPFLPCSQAPQSFLSFLVADASVPFCPEEKVEKASFASSGREFALTPIFFLLSIPPFLNLRALPLVVMVPPSSAAHLF